MANIPDAIKLFAGKVGSAANRVLSAIPQPVKAAAGIAANLTTGGLIPADIYTKERGITEGLQSLGGQVLAAQDRNAAEQKAQQTAGFPSFYGVQQQNITQKRSATTPQSTTNPNRWFPSGSTRSEISMGANVGDVRDFGGSKWRWNGVEWEQANSGSNNNGGDSSSPLGESGVRDIASKIPGMTEEDLAKLDISKWAKETQGRADDIAKQIEEAATQNAEREYNTIIDSLKTQKSEIQTLASQQKEQLGKQKQFTEQGLTEKETTETTNIEKQKKAFEQEKEQNIETLAQNWKDLSLESQRVMRARGISDSAFAASQDSKLMLDFNKGLRQIAVKSQAAFQDFADAVIETNKYYTREKQKLQMDYDNALTNIDNWVRQNIQAIQSQENMALNRKLAEIKNAILQANQLKAQTAQKIADQELGLAVWMQQFQMQLKAAAATAAQNKVSDAWKNIDNVRQNTNIIKTMLENGGEFVKKAGANGQTQWFVHGPAIRPDGTFDWVDAPVSEYFVKTKYLESGSKVSGGSDMFPNILGGKPSFKSVLQYLAPEGLPPLPSAILSQP
jgi:hypothetical protein